ncbi:hypothetical protein F4821DRAFT_225184 [Hypoxylon rubiginosum]|uniref:Uncharacterized protein n=1 Tax=Hypoxylon rubiginosum TaxID=110542 RepID=A0ACC0DHA8_9PEZI|nr:hypothetical protein F4821DRAFT_225184 [Hypoxylon rubiginosum]
MISDSSQKSSMLDACSSGDISTLQKLFTDHGIQRGSKPVYTSFVDPNDSKDATVELQIPPTAELLERAVLAKQRAVVTFLLRTYPSFSLMQEHGVVRAVLDSPDPDILQALCEHEPSFACFSVDYGLRSFLTDACAQPPDKIAPVLHVLLDNGADVNDGWGSGGGALYAAILGSQPLDVIGKIVDKGGVVSTRITSLAIGQGRVDIVELLLNHKKIASTAKAEEIAEEAQKSANPEVVAIARAWAQKGKSSNKKWWKLF